MSSNTHKPPGNSTRLNTKLSSTIQTSSRGTSGRRFEDNSTSGTTKLMRLEVKPRIEAEDRSVSTQAVQMHKFRQSILALDRSAKFPTDGNTLQVIHSKCGGKSMQKAINDISNFKEHVGICQGLYTSDGKSHLKSSLRGGSVPSIHPTTVTLVRPAQLTCPGFSFEEVFGKSYESLPSHEREQVTRAAEEAGLLLPPSEKNISITSKRCLKKNPSHQEPVQPCSNCSNDLSRSNFKNTLRPKTLKPKERYSPFRGIGTG